MKTNSVIIPAYGPANLFSLEEQVAVFIAESELVEGIINLFSIGSTGALVFLADGNKSVFEDYVAGAIPYSRSHRHPGNAFAHLRSTLLKTDLAIPVANSKMATGLKPYLLENTAGRKSRRIDMGAAGKFATGGVNNLNVSNAKLPVKTNGWIDIVDLSAVIDDFIKNTGVRDGIVLASSVSERTAITTIEYETSLLMDTADFLSSLVKDQPEQAKGELLASFLGQSLSIPVTHGRLDLGTWQQIVLVDFGSQGEKEVCLEAVGM
ncbi:MAG: hypothetical protein C4562_07270 [Actinobacteria bacterium]|nr:MAG: hypothetical protein C4562_07270 [Actinomycetota bacterium]